MRVMTMLSREGNSIVVVALLCCWTREDNDNDNDIVAQGQQRNCCCHCCHIIALLLSCCRAQGQEQWWWHCSVRATALSLLWLCHHCHIVGHMRMRASEGEGKGEDNSKGWERRPVLTATVSVGEWSHDAMAVVNEVVRAFMGAESLGEGRAMATVTVTVRMDHWVGAKVGYGEILTLTVKRLHSSMVEYHCWRSGNAIQCDQSRANLSARSHHYCLVVMYDQVIQVLELQVAYHPVIRLVLLGHAVWFWYLRCGYLSPPTISASNYLWWTQTEQSDQKWSSQRTPASFLYS